VLNKIQTNNIAKKLIIKAQLPPKRATLSEIFWPLVKISSGAFSKLFTINFSSLIAFSTIVCSLLI